MKNEKATVLTNDDVLTPEEEEDVRINLILRG
jgi:hypothetical protein